MLVNIRQKMTLTGLGTLLAAGAAWIAWRRSGKHRAKFSSWKKDKIHTAYNKSLDENDIAY